MPSRGCSPGTRWTAAGAALAAGARAVRGMLGAYRAGRSPADETLEASMRRHLAAKVDVQEVAHLEQLETLSRPVPQSDPARARDRVPRLVPSGVDPQVPEDTRWHPLEPELPQLAVLPRGDPPQRPRAPARKALVHESRLRARAAGASRSPSARSLTRRRWPSCERDEPAAGPAAAPAARGHWGAAALRRRRRTPGGDLPLPHEAGSG